MEGFSVIYRNPGHWDFTKPSLGRVFRIRGGPGSYVVFDERRQPDEPLKDGMTFNTLPAAVSYITDQLMYELIVAEGQTPTKIEGWNVT
jgi:hypothetical protein